MNIGNKLGVLALGTMLVAGPAAAQTAPAAATAAGTTAAKVEKTLAFPGVDMSKLSPEAKAAIAAYAALEGTKALAISADGKVAAHGVGANRNEAVIQALSACAKDTTETCAVVSVNGKVQKLSGDKETHTSQTPPVVATPPAAEKPPVATPPAAEKPPVATPPAATPPAAPVPKQIPDKHAKPGATK